tara:strand:+ start:332 stop:1234 length:903 start_codon:yes stop_codon:yes gene_type:complete
MKTVIIFGGFGFVGRHIIRRLAKFGYKIIVPYQRNNNEAKIRFIGNVGQIIPIKFDDISNDVITNSIKNADIVINLKTIWDEKYSSFEREIYEFNKDLIKLIKKDKIFIFFSGLGIERDHNSKRLAIIAKTEEYIKDISNNYSIIRPGIILGGGDIFIERIVKILKLSLIMPLFGFKDIKFQPVYVDDIAKAIEKIVVDNLLGRHIYELFSPNIYSYREFYCKLCNILDIKRLILPMPFSLMKIMVVISSKTPLSLLTLEQLNLFKEDNLPSKKYKNFNNLDIKPQELNSLLEISVKKYN